MSAAEFGDTMRAAAEAVERSRVEAARLAIHAYLRDHPGTGLRPLHDALLPERPFDDTHLREALTDELVNGRLVLTADRQLVTVAPEVTA